jgi:hypothetical protein
MSRRVLFAVGQNGSVEYLSPLWRRWLRRNDGPAWRVALAPGSRERLRVLDLENVPLLAGALNSISALETQLRDWKPHLLVVSASHCEVEEAAFLYAQKHGVPTCRFIDTWYRYRERLTLSDGRFALPDRVLVIDDAAIAQAENAGVPRHLLSAVGHPAWETVGELPAADRRDVMFVSQPVNRFYGDRLGYTEIGTWSRLLEIATTRPDLVRKLVYARHPNDDAPLPAESTSISVAKSGRAAMSAVGTVVGMFSSLLMDALLAGRHVVSFQPDAVGEDMNAMGQKSPMIPRATDTESLLHALAGPPVSAGMLRDTLARSCDRLEELLLGFPVNKSAAI